MAGTLQNASVPIIRPYVPECSREVTYQDDFTEAGAQAYNLTSLDYYESLLPSVVPGIVIGCIALLGFLFFMIWLCVEKLPCCCRGRKSKARDLDAEQQFIDKSESSSNPYGKVDTPQAMSASLENTVTQPAKQGWTAGRVFRTVLLALSIATAGLSIWGLVSSIQETETQIPYFWNIVDQVTGKVDKTMQIMSTVSAALVTAQAAVQTVKDREGDLKTMAANLKFDPQSLITALPEVNSTVNQVRDKLDQARTQVQENMGEAVDTINDDFKPPSFTFQNKGRFVAIGIMFGFTFLISLCAGFLCYTMKHRGWATCCTAALWFIIMLLMLLGTGLMSGLSAISGDTCLYVENFALRFAALKVKDPVKAAWSSRAIEFYVAPEALQVPAGATEEQKNDPLFAIFGLDLNLVEKFSQNPQLMQVAAALNNTNAGAAIQGLGINSDLPDAIQNLAGSGTGVLAKLKELRLEGKRDAVIPLYKALKDYVCCSYSQSSTDLFTSWTTVGCCALVLALMCSGIIIHSFRKLGKL